MFPEGEAAREVKMKNKPTNTNDNTPAPAYDEDLFEEYRAAMIQCLENDNGDKKAMAPHARPQGPQRLNAAMMLWIMISNLVITKGYASFFDEVDEVMRRDSPMQYQRFAQSREQFTSWRAMQQQRPAAAAAAAAVSNGNYQHRTNAL